MSLVHLRIARFNDIVSIVALNRHVTHCDPLSAR
jgi:hypothetical protein